MDFEDLEDLAGLPSREKRPDPQRPAYQPRAQTSSERMILLESVPFNEPDNEELTSFQKEESVERSFGGNQGQSSSQNQPAWLTALKQPDNNRILEDIAEDHYELPIDDDFGRNGSSDLNKRPSIEEPEAMIELQGGQDNQISQNPVNQLVQPQNQNPISFGQENPTQVEESKLPAQEEIKEESLIVEDKEMMPIENKFVTYSPAKGKPPTGPLRADNDDLLDYLPAEDEFAMQDFEEEKVEVVPATPNELKQPQSVEDPFSAINNEMIPAAPSSSQDAALPEPNPVASDQFDSLAPLGDATSKVATEAQIPVESQQPAQLPETQTTVKEESKDSLPEKPKAKDEVILIKGVKTRSDQQIKDTVFSKYQPKTEVIPEVESKNEETIIQNPSFVGEGLGEEPEEGDMSLMRRKKAKKKKKKKRGVNQTVVVDQHFPSKGPLDVINEVTEYNEQTLAQSSSQDAKHLTGDQQEDEYEEIKEELVDPPAKAEDAVSGRIDLLKHEDPAQKELPSEQVKRMLDQIPIGPSKSHTAYAGAEEKPLDKFISDPLLREGGERIVSSTEVKGSQEVPPPRTTASDIAKLEEPSAAVNLQPMSRNQIENMPPSQTPTVTSKVDFSAPLEPDTNVLSPEPSIPSKVPEDPPSVFNQEVFAIRGLKERPKAQQPSSLPSNQTLLRNCVLHPHEPIRYFCRDDSTALCPECVVDHARHDFIMANENASRTVKDSLRQVYVKIEDRYNHYRELMGKLQSNQSLLIHMKDKEIDKISHYFQELRDALSVREANLKRQYVQEVEHQFSFFTQELQDLSRVFEHVDRIFQRAQDMTLSFEQSHHDRVVAAMHQVKDLETQFEEVRSQLGKLYRSDIDYRGAQPIKDLMPVAILQPGAVHQVIQGIGSVSKNALEAKNEERVMKRKAVELVEKQQQELASKEMHRLAQEGGEETSARPLNMSQASSFRKTARSKEQQLQSLYQTTPSPDHFYWLRWGTHEVFKYDFFNSSWIQLPELRPNQRFLFYPAQVHLPKGLGMFILGGTDVDGNFSKRTLYFSKYQKFFEKPPLIQKRAFFSAVFSISDSSIYAIGGQNGLLDIPYCEKFSITTNSWQPTASLNVSRSHAAVICFDKVLFLFGGSSVRDGVLDSIERYSIEFDVWEVVLLRLREPVMHSVAFDLGGARVLIFGGVLNGDVSNKKLDIYDMTSECLTLEDDPIKGQRTYLPGVFEPAFGVFNSFSGFADSTKLTHNKLKVTDFMCSCRTVRFNFKQNLDQIQPLSLTGRSARSAKSSPKMSPGAPKGSSPKQKKGKPPQPMNNIFELKEKPSYTKLPSLQKTPSPVGSASSLRRRRNSSIGSVKQADRPLPRIQLQKIQSNSGEKKKRFM